MYGVIPKFLLQWGKGAVLLVSKYSILHNINYRTNILYG